MAAPENAQTGWSIYKQSDYELTLADINDELTRLKLPPVSARMYSHYRKLHRYGFEQYIPINQLDVRTMEDPVWDRTLRGRYVMRPVEEPVRIYVLDRDVAVVLDAIVEQLSDGEVLLRVIGNEALQTFERVKNVWTIDVAFPATGEVRLAEVLKVTLDPRRTRVTVRATFATVTAAEDVLLATQLVTRRFRVVVGSDPEAPPLARTTQQLFWLFSACEGVRLATSEALRDTDVDGRLSVPSNRVQALRVASPLDAILIAAGPVVVGVSLLISRAVDARKGWWEGSKAKVETAVAEEELLRLRWERDRRDVIAQVDVSDVARAIAEGVRAELGVPGDVGEQKRLEETLGQHALPAIGELLESAQGDIGVDDEADPAA
jgi:hypothetical protein